MIPHAGADNPPSGRTQEPSTPDNASSTAPRDGQEDTTFVDTPSYLTTAAVAAATSSIGGVNATGGDSGGEIAVFTDTELQMTKSQPDPNEYKVHHIDNRDESQLSSFLYDHSSSSQQRPPKKVPKNPARKLLGFVQPGSHERKKLAKGNKNDDRNENKIRDVADAKFCHSTKSQDAAAPIMTNFVTDEEEQQNLSLLVTRLQEDVRELKSKTNNELIHNEIRDLRDKFDALKMDVQGEIALLKQQLQSQPRSTLSPSLAGQFSIGRTSLKFHSDTGEPQDGLPQDTFSLMMISPFYSKAWLLGMCTVVFQLLLVILIGGAQINKSSDSSLISVPFKVDTLTHIGQLLTIIFAVAWQNDVITSIRLLVMFWNDPHWDRTILGREDWALPPTTKEWVVHIVLPNIMKFLQGIFVLFNIWVYVVQSKENETLLAGFLGLMVTSETDNLFFFIAANGFFGSELQKKTIEAQDVKIQYEVSRSNDSSASTGNKGFLVRPAILFLVGAAMIGSWSIIFMGQMTGRYFDDSYPNCGYFLLANDQFGDGECYGGPLNSLGCEFEGGDCINFNMEFPLCRGDNLTYVQRRVGDEICDLEFAIPECDYDGGVCCPYSIINNPLFGDNLCQGGAFNVEGCGFDKGDCNVFNRDFPDCPLLELSYVDGAENITLGNRVCDGGIYSLHECGWENGDCDVGQLGQDLKFIPFNSFQNKNLEHRTAAERMSLDGRTLAIASSIDQRNYVDVLRYDPSKRRWAALGMPLDVHNISAGDDAFTAISMNQAGDRIAIGNSDLDQVQLFDFLPLNQTWVQVGQSIQGESGSAFGLKLAMTLDGSRLVISAPKMSRGAGRIFLYEFHIAQQTWRLLGNPIKGKDSADALGALFVHISSQDGNTVMFSIYKPHPAVTNRIYRYNETSQDWMQLGDDLPSPFALGSSLSSSGNRVAIPSNVLCANNSTSKFKCDDAPGQVQVFDYDETNNTWVQVGETIFGTEKENRNGFGYRTALGDDGNFLSISSVDPRCHGEPNFCGTGNVQLFYFQLSISDFVPAVPRLIVNGNKIFQRERDRDSNVFGSSISLSEDGSTLSVFGYNIDEKVGFVKVYDLTQLFYIRCSVARPEWLGDSECDAAYPYNSEECGFDDGDCPLPSVVEGYPGCYVSDPSRIGDLFCDFYNLQMYNTTECGYDGGDCLPKPVEGYPGCYVNNPSRIGDGFCEFYDLQMYNTTECGYDGGDCLPKPVEGYPRCFVALPDWIGDDYCDGLPYNTTECGYDGGDCLL